MIAGGKNKLTIRTSNKHAILLTSIFEIGNLVKWGKTIAIANKINMIIYLYTLKSSKLSFF
uniref:Uncharacterized protein n=1 Tax=Pithovirus LCPAC406 TaxID=2506599 RepID=A0A481ZDQ2_9VIRU|nr:MAG: hypothetical protein LCPAC406_01000 [Pithovirus LCPAC406]